jgi:membrane protein DedA with SNARE-associated domain
VWGIFFSVGGYVFGGAIESFLGHVKKAEKFIIFGALLGAFIASCIIFLRGRVTDQIEKKEHRLEKKAEESKE